MSPRGRILVVDDEPRQRDILKMILDAEGYDTALAGSGRQALQSARAEPFDVVLTDLKMPDLSGIDLLAQLPQKPNGPSVILMTAHGTIDSAVEAMRRGAFDYLTKPLEKDELLLVLRRAIETSRLERENRMLHEQLRDRFRLENIVGEHGAMQDVFRIVHKVAQSTSTVLIYGESGTGKELVAKALHHKSDRHARPFYAVNVAALPETILEAELFGYEKGAFTGAEARKVGLFEQASGSTLFLDEVGDLKRDLQVKLLRALQEREILRVGGTERIKIDVRIVAATNQDLERAVREGRFREDLYYRLNVIAVRLPPLRERRTDIPLLVEHFVAKYAGGRRRTVSADALKTLTGYDWPGNVRELESVIERALLLGETDRILPEDLPAVVRAGMPAARGNVLDLEIPDSGIDLETVERTLIHKALAKAGGNVSRAARLLGLSRRTLQYRLEKMQAAPDGAQPARKGADGF
ncbi:MAG TPA: sigma-54 dependent transcriptional regulator [Vicinamibacteria bacterium]|nr:sigma-54 dependent transcriptional regulator [Vicinamibacteria bacterium]